MSNLIQFYSDRLHKLIHIAQQNQWVPDKEINWYENVVMPKNINYKTYIDMVSQLYYAEITTIRLIGELLIKTPDLQAKQYLCTQAMDEARHAQVYEKYLAKLGDIAPINNRLKMLFDTVINNDSSYFNMIVALNVVMEGEAINQQYKRIETLPCPLFSQINKAIVKDESRHAAFGKVYMREKLTLLDKNEKDVLFNWVKNLWSLWGDANEQRYTIEGEEILKTSKPELEQRWQYQLNVFRTIGLIDQ